MSDFRMDCPICKEPMMQMVKLFLWCKASQQNFNKTALRSKEIKVSHVDRADPDNYICQQHGTLKAILANFDKETEGRD